MKAEKLAEKIFNEAVENANRRGGNGLSPTLCNDWQNYIESLIDEQQEEIEELKTKLINFNFGK
jgi:hypothetical protein